ncbi:MAG: response regulator transcription factor [Leptolyngbyaceae cyanobacterium SL_1_1]|nr:response regulator transcription factor [Leptolyngbyaceae cyanobacterium RM1_1_2]NJO08599.1 response regulator transcription factor [Leptolyngbyaceae cyanobacterium SL_1_1]
MPLTILVVDDEEGTRLSIGEFLRLSGYAIVAASNGREALMLVEKQQPHLIITDIAMPQLDGYELIQKLRQYPALRLLPVVFLTARNETQDRVRGYQLGCDAYLPKPFELEELGAVVRNLLERTQMMQNTWLQQLQAAAVTPQPLSMTSEQAKFLSPDLTAREQEVLVLLAEGLSNAQIGDRLYLSPRTVEKHVSSLLRKTETNNRAELVRFALDHHLIK